MFTGIIETTGQITAIHPEGTNLHFTLSSPISKELKIDQSVAHNGACLTVIKCDDQYHTVTAIAETSAKTNLGFWKVGSKVNLERCMPANGRFDGHIVQGHVDTTGKCANIVEMNGSWIFSFSHPNESNFITVEKGSICINGTSLTVVNSAAGSFDVAIIPYTFHNTIFNTLKVGDTVNLEFDIIGKYVEKMLALRDK